MLLLEVAKAGDEVAVCNFVLKEGARLTSANSEGTHLFVKPSLTATSN